MIVATGFALQNMNRIMNPKTERNDDWEACPAGALQGLAKRSRQRRSMKRAVLMVPLAVILLLALTWSGLVSMPFGSNSGPLLCDQVERLLPAYAANTLSASQREQVLKHLNKCPFCRAKLQAIEAAQAIAFRTPIIEVDKSSWILLWSNDFVRRPLAIDG